MAISEEYFRVYLAVEEDTSPDVPDGTHSYITLGVICIQLHKEATYHYLKMAAQVNMCTK